MNMINCYKVSVIVATYNEIANLEKLSKEVFLALDVMNCDSELIIVDDNSPDGSFTESLRLARIDTRIRPILRESNRGLAASIYEGLKAASKDIVIIMDADLSHSPLEFHKILSNFSNTDLNMVWASRYVSGGSIEESQSFTLQFNLSKIFNRVIMILLKIPVLDTTNGYFSFRRYLFNENEFSDCFNGYGDFSFLFLHKLIFLNYVDKKSVLEIPSRYYQRIYGHSKTKLLKVGINYIFAAIKARLNHQ
jgi:dolichol-phosphate mannosyltransferase